MDYFWVLAPISAGFGALLTGLLLRRLGISRTSYREARQMLSAMVGSLSKRIEQNEAITRELSEQLQILSSTQARLGAEGKTAERERLLEFIQDWMENVKRVVQKVDGLQKNLRSVEQEIEDMRIRVEQLTGAETRNARAPPASPGVVREDTVTKLTPTEKTVLELLVAGPKAAPEIGRLVVKSREHTARLMKALFEQGFVDREENRQPYEYRLNDKVKEVLLRTIQQEATQPEG